MKSVNFLIFLKIKIKQLINMLMNGGILNYIRYQYKKEIHNL